MVVMKGYDDNQRMAQSSPEVPACTRTANTKLTLQAGTKLDDMSCGLEMHKTGSRGSTWLDQPRLLDPFSPKQALLPGRGRRHANPVCFVVSFFDHKGEHNGAWLAKNPERLKDPARSRWGFQATGNLRKTGKHIMAISACFRKRFVEGDTSCSMGHRDGSARTRFEAKRNDTLADLGLKDSDLDENERLKVMHTERFIINVVSGMYASWHAQRCRAHTHTRTPPTHTTHSHHPLTSTCVLVVSACVFTSRLR